MPVKKYQKVIYTLILVFSLLWCSAILLAPLWHNTPGISGDVSEALYTFFETSCHQQDSRSFHIGEEKFGVCSRCTSIYFGFLLAVIVYPFIRKLSNLDLPPIIYLLIAATLMIIDAGLDTFNILKNTFVSREITGVVMGFVLPLYIIPGTIRLFHEFFKPPVINPKANNAGK